MDTHPLPEASSAKLHEPPAGILGQSREPSWYDTSNPPIIALCVSVLMVTGTFPTLPLKLKSPSWPSLVFQCMVRPLFNPPWAVMVGMEAYDPLLAIMPVFPMLPYCPKPMGKASPASLSRRKDANSQPTFSTLVGTLKSIKKEGC